jgi:hypothetical protein
MPALNMVAMFLNAQRRLIAAFTLLALLFGAAAPALAVVHQALDPAAFASICRVDDAAAQDQGGAPDRLKSVHCPLCLGHAAPPAADSHAPQCIGVVSSELRISPPAAVSYPADAAVLQPLNPRAPPRA